MYKLIERVILPNVLNMMSYEAKTYHSLNEVEALNGQEAILRWGRHLHFCRSCVIHDTRVLASLCLWRKQNAKALIGRRHLNTLVKTSWDEMAAKDEKLSKANIRVASKE
ncbi:hypothetical protein V6N11_008466 [Hibiscus sabdariffa]|uniref:Uncharacterized protein n=2 Tax=Hibiscus sabdariffa TaxID=183260 RepID=A0ABR1ZM22_9ROSI